MNLESDGDSDNELLPTNNAFTFQNERTVITAKGPNINTSSITGISFRNNVLSSTMQMSRNFDRSRQAESNYNKQNMPYRRGTSPMSMMSACDVRQRNFNNTYNRRGMSSQRSAYNGRSGSPMSMRTIDSSASQVSAADIAMAITTSNFNKYEFRLIKEAYNKYMKHRVRKRIEKKRNLRRFLKGGRRKSGGDSGDQASNSSLSSDDRSRTSNLKNNMSSCRSIQMDISNFKRNIQDSNLCKDSSDNFRQNSFRGMVSGPVNLNNTQASVSSHRSMISNMSSCRSMPVSANFNNRQGQPTSKAIPQKERFKSGFLPPSQRFNRSVASSTIPEYPDHPNHHKRNNFLVGENTKSTRNIESDSEQDDILSETTKETYNHGQRKRSIDSDEIFPQNQKRTKITSSCKNNIEAIEPMPKKTTVNSNNSNDTTNDFIFTKPTLPIRKSAKEKLISKSAAPVLDTLVQETIILPVNLQNSQPEKPVEQEKEDNDEELSNTTQNSTDLSARPSFIKRKLFTQKLDVTEKINMSMDNLNSPQNSIYGAIQKEKHKARKLQQATTQSCLSRDVLQDESNIRDLINKIVPLEQLNETNQTSKTESQNSRNKTEKNKDKWDVISIISECKNDEDISDTYTDEEIFNATVRDVAKENVSTKKPSPLKTKSCKIVIKKLTPSKLQQYPKSNVKKDDVAKKSVQKHINSFWDTDFESDVEYQPPSKHDVDVHPKGAPKFQGCYNMFNSKKTSTASTSNASTFLNNTVDSVQKFNNTRLRIRSNTTPKRKKLNQTRDEDEKSELLEPQKKAFQASNCVELSISKPKAQTELQKTKIIETATKHISKPNKKSPKGKKQATKVDKLNLSTQSVKPVAPTKRTTNNTIKPVKTAPSETKTINSKKVTDKNEQQSKKKETDIIKKKTTQSAQKGKNKKLDNTLIEELVKDETTDKKTTQSKQKPKNRKRDVSENRQEKKQAENKLRKQSPNAKKTKNNSSFYELNTTEENNNISQRLRRSCRNSKLKESLDKSNLTLNETLNRTLRSRQIDLTSMNARENKTNTRQKVNKIHEAKSKLSDKSFLLSAEKNALAKGATKKITDSKVLKLKDVNASDVSFSLTLNGSPTPKKATVKPRGGKKHNDLVKSKPLKKNATQCKEIFVSKNEFQSVRNRIPNKRFLIC